ncbi:MAG: glycogen synthase GlgA [Beijerinckiaceae bacterium]
MTYAANDTERDTSCPSLFAPAEKNSRIEPAPSLRRRILFVTTEIADYVKVGGLGEVSAALPRALAADFDVRVLIPGYSQVLARHNSLTVVGELDATANMPACRIARALTGDGLIVYIVLAPELYERDGSPYGDRTGADWPDNHIRFGRLCSAAAEIALGRADASWCADLVHCNDWPSALTPAYMRWRGRTAPSVLTVHNLAYQGLFPREAISDIGVPENAFHMEGVEFYDQLSFMKAGLIFADHITTVSENYAREITTQEFGCGLDGVLRRRAAEGRLTGIVNGIDDSWNPSSDPHLAARFEAGDWASRRVNTRAVREAFGLGESKGPLFAVVSRLVQQKGVDLVIEAADEIVAHGGQIVVIGQGEAAIEKALRGKFAKNPRDLGLHVGFEERLARRMFAGSDFLLMPSRFEPCGLSQMFAQRAGSLPIVHRTGGLADTVRDGVTGFQFRSLTLDGLLGGVRRAFAAFHAKPLLSRMRRNAMGESFSWKESAGVYGSLYLRGIGNR